MTRPRFSNRATQSWLRPLLGVAALGLMACASEKATSDGRSADAAPEAGNDPATLALEAFSWGYPRVVTQRTLQTLGALVGVNSLFNQAALTTPAARVIVAPNQDTLYSVAVLDLRSEPVVLTVPDVLDRYWTYQLLDGWMESFHYIGTRATDGHGGTFVIAPPGWTGQVPAGAEVIEAPTPELFLLGRYLVQDEADVLNVVAIQRTLQPLHAVNGTPAPEPPPELGAAPGTPQQVGEEGAAFFDELGDALSVGPPASEADRAAMDRFAPLGIGPGLHPSADGTEEQRNALGQAVREGLVRIDDFAAGSPPVDGWTTRLDVGSYGGGFLLRAATAKLGWGANVPEESVYPVSRADRSGAPYDASKRYVMHFDELPPVDPDHGFWSLTLYGPDMFFVENSIHRYAIGDRTPGLTFNADGSLDLLVQRDPPVGRQGNWLPAPPTGPFVLMMRLYLPGAPVLDGSYRVPGVAPGG